MAAAFREPEATGDLMGKDLTNADHSKRLLARTDKPRDSKRPVLPAKFLERR